jgi:hypothetical protein
MPYTTETGPVDLTNLPSGNTINPLGAGVNQGVSGAPGMYCGIEDAPLHPSVQGVNDIVLILH